MMVTASSLVVIIFGSSFESEWSFLRLHEIFLITLIQVKLDAGTSAVILCDKKRRPSGGLFKFMASSMPLQKDLT
jgi:hypothetical protein